jgi:hypothetical protein
MARNPPVRWYRTTAASGNTGRPAVLVTEGDDQAVVDLARLVALCEAVFSLRWPGPTRRLISLWVGAVGVCT